MKQKIRSLLLFHLQERRTIGHRFCILRANDLLLTESFTELLDQLRSIISFHK